MAPARLIRFPDTWLWTARSRDAHGLRPRPRLGLAQLRAALLRLRRGAQIVLRRAARPLPLETLIWILIVALVVLYAVALFTRERAIAP